MDSLESANPASDFEHPKDVMGTSAAAAHVAPFQLDWQAHGSIARAVTTVAKPLLARLLSLKQLNSVHAGICSLGNVEPFCERALRSLQVKLVVDDAALQTIPKAGPLIVVANHPFGGLDGLALLAL